MKALLFTPALFGLFFILAPSVSAADLSYATVLDRSAQEAEIEVKGLTYQTRYVCNLLALTCEEREDTSIIPQELTKHVAYYVSPENEFAIATEFIPYKGPKHTAYRLSDGKLTRLAELNTTFDIARVRWSNGDTALLSLVDGTHFIANVRTGALRRAVGVPPGASWTTLSPDATFLAYYLPATQSRTTRTFGVVNLASGVTNTFEEPVAYWDLLTEGNTLFAFSPDSSQLLYLSDRSGYPTLYRVALKALTTGSTLAGEQLITRAYSVADFAWKDAQTIVFTANRDNALRYDLYAYTPATGTLTTVLTDASYDSALYSAGDKLLVNRIVGTARVPHLFDTKTGSVQKLPVNQEGASAKQGTLVTPAGMTGAWLAEAGSRDTLLVWLHGGPYRQSSLSYHPYASYAGYDWMLSRLQDNGVGVLKLDYPGSMGYGRAYAESITGNVGTLDVARTHAAIQAFAKANGYKEVRLMGNSYGGYLALRLLAEHPGNYEGAFSINGVTDWDALTAQLQTSIFNVQFNGLRNPNNDALYAAASIRDRITSLSGKDVVLTHGTKDTSVPYAQATLLNAALAEHRIDAELLTFEDENHVYARPETFERLCERAFEFSGKKAGGACEL